MGGCINIARSLTKSPKFGQKKFRLKFYDNFVETVCI